MKDKEKISTSWILMLIKVSYRKVLQKKKKRIYYFKISLVDLQSISVSSLENEGGKSLYPLL